MDIDLINEKLAALEQKRNSRTRIEVVLSELHTLTLETRHTIYQWRQIYDLAHNRPDIFGLFDMFLFKTGSIMAEKIILDLSKIFDRGKDAVNHQYLVNLINNAEKKTIELKALAKLNKAAQDSLITIEQYADLVLRMKSKRDKEIAHMDKSILGSYEEVAKVEMEEMEHIAESIANIYSDFYEIGSFGKATTLEDYLDSMKTVFSISFDDLTYLVDYALDNLDRAKQTESINKAIFSRSIQKHMKDDFPAFTNEEEPVN
jgi:hypothetical protein